MKNQQNKILTKDLASNEIRTELQKYGIKSVAYLGRFSPKSGYRGRDWEIDIYELPNGNRVAETNGNAVWQAEDRETYRELEKEYGVEI